MTQTARIAMTALIVLTFIVAGCGDEYMTSEEDVATNDAGQTLRLAATPDNLDVNSGGAITVLAELYADDGSPISGANVLLTSTLGALGESKITTDVDGIAATTLTANGVTGYAVIVATYKGLQVMINADFYEGDPSASAPSGDNTGGFGDTTATDTGTGTGA